MKCEDFPSCGHESGCCPDYDETGTQQNMICTCGKELPITSRFSVCSDCLAGRTIKAENYKKEIADKREIDR